MENFQFEESPIQPLRRAKDEREVFDQCSAALLEISKAIDNLLETEIVGVAFFAIDKNGQAVMAGAGSSGVLFKVMDNWKKRINGAV